jgi:predicted regulator of Ras-like GTPase activity (Roadblock/LC7/MglB family)
MDHTRVRGAMLRLAYGAPQACAARNQNRTEIQVVVAARVTVKAQRVDARLSRTNFESCCINGKQGRNLGFVESVRV